MQEYNVIDSNGSGFVDKLIKEFRDEWEILLRARRTKREDPHPIKAYVSMPTPWAMRDPLWRAKSVPTELIDRRVEITGPAVDPRMAINALNSGAHGYMVDGEDSLAPTWANVMQTQRTLMGIVRRTLAAESNGKKYTINDHPAVLHYRPRGLHMVEAHYRVDCREVPACLFDVGLFLWNNATELLVRGSAPYLYLPKLETENEAKFWNRVFGWIEDELKLPAGCIRVTVLIETLPGLLRTESLVWSLRDRITGLNVGRWDYMLSLIRTMHGDSSYVLPDRDSMVMDSAALSEYARWIVRVAHRRGIHAIGGMAAHVPNRKDPVVSAAAIDAVRRDKKREVMMGHDGTWVAHPDLVPVALEVFNHEMSGRHEQRWNMSMGDSLDLSKVLTPMTGVVTECGVRDAVRTALLYLDAWLGGNGCVAISGKMEDAATAEISRALLWQWVARGTRLDDGRVVDANWVTSVIRGEAAALGAAGTEPRARALELLFDSIISPILPDHIISEAYKDIITLK
jgi:malate synthase